MTTYPLVGALHASSRRLAARETLEASSTRTRDCPTVLLQHLLDVTTGLTDAFCRVNLDLVP